MAIYSGFGNRHLEDRYNQCIKRLISLFNQIVITYVEQRKIQPFKNAYQQIYDKMHQLETRKYSQPKFSEIMLPLNEHLSLSESAITQAMSQPANKKRPKTGHLIGGASLNLKNTNQKQKGHHRILRIPKKSQHNQSMNYTINTPPSDRMQRVKRRYQSYSVDGKKDRTENQDLSQLSMQQLMRRHPIIDKKLSNFRKKMYQNNKFPKIEQEQQGEQQNFN